MDNPTEISGFIHNVSFPPKPIPQANITSLSGVHHQQLITIKARVTCMKNTFHVNTSIYASIIISLGHIEVLK